MTETKETPAAQATPETTEAAPAAATESEAAEDSSPTAAEAGGDQTNGADTAAAETNGDEKEEDKPEPPKEMRAIVLTGFGGLKGVKVLKKPEPSVQAGEVLIRVKSW